ncbi:cytochrome b5 domain-containing protein [Patescibacteria group bacterium]|nr:cytochrome b5 domain-containing protein [Patescibacteria group bacterium]
MNKYTSAGIVAGIAVFGIAATLAFKQSQGKPYVAPTDTNTNQATNSENTTDARVRGYTLAQVAEHGTAASCWSAVNGDVYDLSDWIAQHPGGEGAIISICGKDGSAAFNTQHSGDGRPEAALSNFKIGALAQ